MHRAVIALSQFNDMVNDLSLPGLKVERYQHQSEEKEGVIVHGIMEYSINIVTFLFTF
jgi:hypothetical protein